VRLQLGVGADDWCLNSTGAMGPMPAHTDPPLPAAAADAAVPCHPEARLRAAQ
jgi:hypothetical protein